MDQDQGPPTEWSMVHCYGSAYAFTLSQRNLLTPIESDSGFWGKPENKGVFESSLRILNFNSQVISQQFNTIWSKLHLIGDKKSLCETPQVSIVKQMLSFQK